VFNTMLEQLRQQVQRIREESEARARVEGELELAREIQTSLLPREVPAVCSQGAFEIQASNLAASQVAGDFYDYFADAKGRLLLVIADVAGHGVPAALLMAVTRTLIRSLATGGLSPAEITLRTNQALMDNGTLGMFVTLVLCMYDPATGELTYTNAGHPAPLVVHADGSDATRCGSTAPLLGAYAFTQEQCEQRMIQMRPGDTLVLYTDGIPEARPTVDAEEFGQERFRAVLSANADRPLRALCDNVVAAVRQYQQGPPSDDLTLLLLRRR
jgi:sigma-B regulation protein RsbU (phosphoserine phosphatase)